jgi:hypothetical protein
VGTLPLDHPSRVTMTLLVWGSLLFGKSTFDWISCIQVCVIISTYLVSFPIGILSPCKSISHKEFYSWSLFFVIQLSWWIGPTRKTGVYLVCVSFPFDLYVECIVFIVFFMFITLPS